MSLLFSPAIIRHEGATRRAFRMQCGHCGKDQSLPVNTMKGADDGREQAIVADKFRKHGWKVGASAPAHRCPGCFAAIRNAKRGPKMTPEKIPAPDPRTMQREEKRLIFAKIHEVYLDEKRGYAEAWSDAKIASDLGVPRAWVKEVREENFGPEASSENLRSQVAEARVILGEIKKISPQADDLVGKCRTLIASADRIERLLTAIEAGLRG